MKPNEKKSVPIEHEVWREMAQEKLDSGKDIYELVAEGWRAYKSLKTGTRPLSELQGKSEVSQAEAGLPALPPGLNLKGTRLALYRELAVKVAEVLAEGSGELRAILERGIRWAHSDLRPPRSEDSHAHAQGPRPKEDGPRRKGNAR